MPMFLLTASILQENVSNYALSINLNVFEENLLREVRILVSIDDKIKVEFKVLPQLVMGNDHYFYR